MQAVEATARSQAKWGSACASCSAAKAQCLRRGDSLNGSCERCTRLRKQCIDQSREPRKKRVNKPSRTAILEERLNGLFELLTTSGDISAVKVHALQASRSPVSSASDDKSESTQGLPQRPSSPLTELNITIPEFYNDFAPPKCFCRGQTGETPLQRLSDAQLLDIYRTRLMPNFPFVVLAPDMDAPRLRAERPFLMSAICMVASVEDPPSMRGQMFALIERIFKQMLVQSERSLDLLQGILLALGWYHHHCLVHTQLNNLIHLAQSLIGDVGLNRGVELQERTSVLMTVPLSLRSRTNEERRAVLGVWYITSCVSVGVLRIQPMRFTKYLRQSLQDLEDAHECESDKLMVYLIQVQRLTEQIHATNNRMDDEPEMSGLPCIPTASYQLAFQAEIERIQTSLPEILRANSWLQLRIRAAAVHLYEPPTVDADLLYKLSENLTSDPGTLNVLYRARNALQEFCDSYLAIPTSSYPYFNVTVCLDWFHGVVMLARWAKLMGPRRTWDSDQMAEILKDPMQDPSFRPSRLKADGNNGHAMVADGDSEGRPAKRHDRPGEQSKIPQGNASSVDQLSRLVGTQPITDTKTHYAIRALRAKLNQQPDLHMDPIGILTALANKFKEAQRRTGGQSHSTVWDVSYKKTMIARARLAKWAADLAMENDDNGQHGPGPGQQVSTNERLHHHVTRATTHRDDYRDSTAGGYADSTSAKYSMYTSQQQQQGLSTAPDIGPEHAMPSVRVGQFDASLLAEMMNDTQMDDLWVTTGGPFDQLDLNLWADDAMDWGGIGPF